MAIIEISLLLLTLAVIFYKWATKTFKTFEERGIPYEKPLPMLGNVGSAMTGKGSLIKVLLNFYQRNKEHKIVGFYNFRAPIFIVNDTEIIKKLTIKDFDYFPNHKPFFSLDNEPLLEAMLSVMKDQRWKDMRNTLSPVFTASKMRNMFSLLNECFDESLKFVREKAKNTPDGYELELKEYFTRLSNDVIASTAFGLKVNSYEDRENEFYKIGQSISNFRGKQLLKLTFASVAPQLMKKLNVKLFEPEKTKYFMRLVLDTMKYREEHKIVRHDMIQLLMEAKNESSHHWSDEDIVAQCFIFFFAAFENNANLLCTTCHELMNNPDVQERLYEEVVQTRVELNGAPLNYDSVGKMKYMDMVVSESLRKWTIAPMTDRVCSKDYDLKDDTGNLIFQFKAGDNIWIPIIGLHNDENYFDNPDEFNPERFNDDNKDNIKQMTYIPFGVGPRICIANRYALMHAKAMLYYLLLDFKLERSPKTIKNLWDDISGFQMNPRSGFWLSFVSREQKNTHKSS